MCGISSSRRVYLRWVDLHWWSLLPPMFVSVHSDFVLELQCLWKRRPPRKPPWYSYIKKGESNQTTIYTIIYMGLWSRYRCHKEGYTESIFIPRTQIQTNWYYVDVSKQHVLDTMGFSIRFGKRIICQNSIPIVLEWDKFCWRKITERMFC